MAHISLFLFALFTSVLLALASPAPVANGELLEIQKRLTHTGRGTWFHPGKGNCGKVNTDADFIVAIGKGLYDRNGGSNCDQWVEIVNVANGKKAYGMTRDSCPECSDNDLDMSTGLFQTLAPLKTGVITVSWHFMKRGWKP